MKQENVRFTVLVEPTDRSYRCQLYIHNSFFPELEDAMLEAEAAWNLDNPDMSGIVTFVSEGFGWDPRNGRPDPSDKTIFRQ